MTPRSVGVVALAIILSLLVRDGARAADSEYAKHLAATQAFMREYDAARAARQWHVTDDWRDKAWQSLAPLLVDPTQSTLEAWVLCARCRLLIGDRQGAALAYVVIQQLKPAAPDAQLLALIAKLEKKTTPQQREEAAKLRADYVAAFKAVAAGRGDAVQLAELQLMSKGVPGGWDAGLATLRRAAEAGNLAAMSRYAQILVSRGSDNRMKEGYRWYLRAAEAGHAEAMMQVGLCLRTGLGTEIDDGEAIAWLERSLAAGHVPAAIRLARIHLNGTGVARDADKAMRLYQTAIDRGTKEEAGRALFEIARHYHFDKDSRNITAAIQWYGKAAAAGNTEAMTAIGVLCAEGKEIPRDLALAEAWFSAAASAGSRYTAWMVGHLYTRGRELPRDPARAYAWFHRGAITGHAASMREVAIRLFTGDGVPRDDAAARRWLDQSAAAEPYTAIETARMSLKGDRLPRDAAQARRAYLSAAQTGDGLAMIELGVLLEAGIGGPRDDAAAAKWFSEAGEDALEVWVALRAGDMYFEGELVPRNDAMALAWYRKAAAFDAADALIFIALMLDAGRGEPRNEKEAQRLLDSVAARDPGRIAHRIGERYADGRRLPADPLKAFNWYRKSAEAAFPAGMFKLGLCHFRGTGTPVDKAMARHWLEKAEATGFGDAVRFLDSIE